MPKLTKDQRDALTQERGRWEAVDNALHRSYPPGGNAHHEEAMKVVTDRLREIKSELEKGE